MNQVTNLQPISLAEKLGITNISFFPTATMLNILSVSDTMLGRYRDDLLEVKCPGFQWHFYQKGCSEETMEVLWQYAQLVKLVGRPQAKELIASHMEKYGVSSKNTKRN